MTDVEGGVLGAVLALAVAGAARGGRPNAAAAEMVLTAVLGGLLALLAVRLTLEGLPFGMANGTVAGWVFFILPGLFDTGCWLLGLPARVPGEFLRLLAVAVGAAAGAFDGWRGIHRWPWPGAAAFVADVTWGLAGTTAGLLSHGVNRLGPAGGDPVPARRMGAHRYRGGVKALPGYVITLGNVVSNYGRAPAAVWRHEMVHVLQNRVFGPLFTLTYLLWFVWGLPFALAEGRRRGDVFAGVMKWCYRNNPWERWAYKVGGYRPSDVVLPGRVFWPLAAAFWGTLAGLLAWRATLG